MEKVLTLVLKIWLGSLYLVWIRIVGIVELLVRLELEMWIGYVMKFLWGLDWHRGGRLCWA